MNRINEALKRVEIMKKERENINQQLQERLTNIIENWLITVKK
jgi:hypothetical protein